MKKQNKYLPAVMIGALTFGGCFLHPVGPEPELVYETPRFSERNTYNSISARNITYHVSNGYVLVDTDAGITEGPAVHIIVRSNSYETQIEITTLVDDFYHMVQLNANEGFVEGFYPGQFRGDSGAYCIGQQQDIWTYDQPTNDVQVYVTLLHDDIREVTYVLTSKNHVTVGTFEVLLTE